MWDVIDGIEGNKKPGDSVQHAIPWMLVHLKRIRDFSVPK